MKKDTQQNSTDSTLNPKQIEVIEALASGASVSETTKGAGVDRSTIYLWRNKSRANPSLHLVTGKNAGNLSSQRDLHANRRREFSSYSAPFPVIRNRELSGK